MISRLVHVGNVVVDLVAAVPALPARGADVLAHRMDAVAGGGFNVLAAAARQGLPAVYAGPVGTGPFADIAVAALRAEGVEVRQRPRPTDTGIVLTVVDDEGERTFVTSPASVVGATGAELAAVVPRPGDAISVSGYELLHGPTRDALLPWIAALPAAVAVVHDPGPLAPWSAPGAVRALLDRADWVTANAAEARRITGRTDPADAACALGGRAGALVRTGAEGCWVAVGGAAPVHVPGFAVDAVDTTGAGDTHTGAFLAALARGQDPVAAARTANAAAALSVTRPGPATGPTTAALADFLATRHGAPTPGPDALP
ncbi:PfkB family carbohydrate kinase [Pseudonocardia humida]|uniref:Bifunctional hydroxymethylpyrimidine kinase/phosphomethylpyrimidine kinase n=1 Tax=Pseudonocardia humida TaxID=2800819 RepID=A0ABT1ADJ4_9PSEU|nr:PfkB family carbohydrate kinase [Pseudonocardia humida]MCO1661016.1 bifunctional hydroxymethylpyrimidine kinase/phosphomethylpyrimidine kinase [Pseudonocardia humida]